MHTEVTKLAFEASFRYLAALTSKGSVSVWKLKGLEPTHQWNLSFKSVSDVVANTAIENQFFIVMNSEDISGPQNSVLLFQYSRPQNLVMYWRFKTPLNAVVFSERQSCLMVINRNGESQKGKYAVQGVFSCRHGRACS